MGTKNVHSVPCALSGCDGRAEPERGGDHTYMECIECGYAFGFQRVNPHPANPVEVQSLQIGRHHG